MTGHKLRLAFHPSAHRMPAWLVAHDLKLEQRIVEAGGRFTHAGVLEDSQRVSLGEAAVRAGQG